MSAVCSEDNGADTLWIVAGDFNTYVAFVHTVDRGNQQVVEHMIEVGLTDCRSYHQSELESTFQDSSGMFRHQLDFCFVGEALLKRLCTARTWEFDFAFHTNFRLSDLLPIVCVIAHTNQLGGTLI